MKGTYKMGIFTKKKQVELLQLNDMELDRKVKIQGTIYDRKRKITDKTIKKMQKMSKRKSVAEIAKELGLNYITVKYNVDPEFRKQYNERRNGKHTGKTHITDNDRIAYKRSLVAKGKLGK